MQNNVQTTKELVRPEVPVKKAVEQSADAENVVEFATRFQLIAQQCEEACQLTDTPDFDVFEEKYGLIEFA